MITETFKGNMTCLEPLHHGSNEDYGTTKLILRLDTVIKNESGEKGIDKVPAIHGNAIRGKLRRLMMQEYLDLLDYQLDSMKVYHFLFTGGMLEAGSSADKGAIDLKLKQRLRELIPPISLLGSALGNQMIQGKLKVGLGNLVCKETADYISDEYDTSFGAYNLKASDFGTRLDDLKESKPANDDDKKEKEQSTQMMYEFETIIRGAMFTHEFVLEDANPVEKACFVNAVNLLKERPYLGGKGATGYGKMKFDYPTLEGATDTAYRDYVNDNKEEMIKLLDELVGTWK
jgi:CRISPR/Cas system CSM-associated protein Csm3 (group 7 of RAMP superfamily)